jgi:hypothetical protein
MLLPPIRAVFFGVGRPNRCPNRLLKAAGKHGERCGLVEQKKTRHPRSGFPRGGKEWKTLPLSPANAIYSPTVHRRNRSGLEP